MIPVSRFILPLALIVAFLPTASYADKYAPPGLYDVEYLTLNNDFGVVLKHRQHAHNVAVRLVVDVGHRHFPCKKRETAHFLEHLLFTGTSTHTETELDRLIEDNGGTWNAVTSQSNTEYQIDIFDENLTLAIDTLFEIITDSLLTPEKVERTRQIIHKELGGKTSTLRRWLYKRGIGKPAAAKSQELLFPGTGVVCPGLDTPEGITAADIEQAYQRYYTPNRMTLIVVGNFDEARLRAQIDNTFGQLKPAHANASELRKPPYPSDTAEVTGTLAPLLGSNGSVSLAYRTDGSNSSDIYALWVLNVFLDRVLYEKIRVLEGLSYSPEAYYIWDVGYGLFAATADSELDRLDLVRTMIDEELAQLRTRSPNAEDIETAKQRILLSRAQGYESNAQVANYYVKNLHELKSLGQLTNHEQAVEKLTPKDIHEVVNKYLRADRQVTLWSIPTLTYTQFFAFFAAALVVLLMVVVYAYWRIRRRHTPT
ncbi:MAG: insulinase family protein [Gammaproteobacteria bacterium]|nr:insulinase family protein [Gammaproteobacteria bacterium]